MIRLAQRVTHTTRDKHGGKDWGRVPNSTKTSQLLKRQQEPDRDLITGLTIGDFVLGLGYVSFIMDDDEAKIFIMRGPGRGSTLRRSSAPLTLSQ
uniref:Uncharacterized protein n=1 Tax=Cyprinus carpio TaxID=7962 RepID=A0A8C2I7G3_CYPCA